MTRPADTETLYRQGVARWLERDVAGAADLLEAALAAHSGPDDDGWWFSASRALAQLSLEQDDPETALRHLALLPGHGAGDAQQYGLRARLALLKGDRDDSALEVSVAVASLATDFDTDIGTLMNGAIALMWCGEVLVELGYGDEAARLADTARRRIAAAGIEDPTLEAGLAMVEAGAARLRSDAATALSALAKIDPVLSPEFGIQITLEQARLAWVGGDPVAARSLYGEAEAECRNLHYPAPARLIRAESYTGPTAPRSDPLPVEEWAERRMTEVMADPRPYAVVARLTVDRPLAAYFELERRVEDLLEANPHLGYLDGNGTDGEVFELFFEGDDPRALWEAVALLVTPLAGQVELRRGDEVETFSLA